MSNTANINTSLLKKKKKNEDKAMFFYSLIQLIANNDMLRNTMSMTQKEKEKYLSNEINHYLPLFQSFPDVFKKWIFEQQSPKIQDILNLTGCLTNTKGSNLYKKKKRRCEWGDATQTQT